MPISQRTRSFLGLVVVLAGAGGLAVLARSSCRREPVTPSVVDLLPARDAASARAPLHAAIPAPAVAPAAAVPGDALIVAEAERVVLVPESGGAVVPIGTQRAAACWVDPGREILFYTQAEPGITPDGGDRFHSLYAQDLRAPDRHHLLATHLPDNTSNSYEIGFGFSEGKLGGQREAPGDWGAELLVEMSQTPRLHAAVLGCDGDAVWYCRVMHGSSDEDDRDAGAAPARDAGTRPAHDGGAGSVRDAASVADAGSRPDGSEDEWPLIESLALTLAQLKQVRLVGADAIRELAARPPDARPDGGSEPAASAPDPLAGVPLPKKLRVPSSSCEGGSDCGKVQRIPGTAFWTVYFGDSYGDFYHDHYQLYDPLKKRFLDLDEPDLSSPRPLSHQHDLSGSLRISRSGKLWLRGNQVFAPGGTPPALPPKATVCGFLRPGHALSL